MIAFLIGDRPFAGSASDYRYREIRGSDGSRNRCAVRDPSEDWRIQRFLGPRQRYTRRISRSDEPTGSVMP